MDFLDAFRQEAYVLASLFVGSLIVLANLASSG
jgi:hypothetical protein